MREKAGDNDTVDFNVAWRAGGIYSVLSAVPLVGYLSRFDLKRRLSSDVSTSHLCAYCRDYSNDVFLFCTCLFHSPILK